MRIFLALFSLIVWSLPLMAVIDGTTGTPLGGLGTGAVKFKAGDGTFTFTDATPTRRFDYQSLGGAQFQLYTKRNGTVVTRAPLAAGRTSAGRVTDDAVFPIHHADFDSVNSFFISLNAFAPFDPSRSDSMSLPCALYEFTITNRGSSPADISIAFQLTTQAVPAILAGEGFADNSSQHRKCIVVHDESGAAIVSAGNGTGFAQTGLCSNDAAGTTNMTAALLTFSPGDKKTVTFVFAWYNASDPARYYYTNLFSNATGVARAASQRASLYRKNAFDLVNEMRASNLPVWLVDQTLNSLVNIVNNSIYTADGRYCHNEGMYTMDGTMDQMWQARQINIELMPDIAWKELEYWARCQKKGSGAIGQIHHDFGSGSDYAIAAWDESEYADYRDIDGWVDLNCGFIISVYEVYSATADRTKLTLLWPYVKKAGQRILNQVALYGDPAYPLTFASSLSSYDAGGNSQAYNTGLSIAAYSILRSLAIDMGEPALATTYGAARDTAVQNFSKKWLDKIYSTGGYCESILGGPWILNFLKLDQFWPSSKLDNLYSTIDNYYSPTTNGLGDWGYNEWQTYLVSHLGGYSLQTGRGDIWHALQSDMAARNTDDRNLVFNEQLGIPSRTGNPVYGATSSSGANQYISIPVLWRNYYDLIGYHRNKATGELWLEPNIPPEMNHTLTNALAVSPEGFSVISAAESRTLTQNLQISFTTDRAVRIDTLYLKDTYGANIRYVHIDGIDAAYTRIGTGYQKRLKVRWSGTIGSEGLSVEVAGDTIETHPPAVPTGLRATPISPSRIDLSWHDNASNETGYVIECKSTGVYKQIAALAANETTYTHIGLFQNVSYTYRVSAFNADGSSGYSNEVTATTHSAGNGEVIFAVNAGGPAFQGAGGIAYASDIGAAFCSGGTAYTTTTAIDGTDDDVVYQSERYGDFTYSIPVVDGDYEVTLKFAEIYQDAAGRRIFNVTIENEIVLSNFDIFALVGKFSACDIIVPVSVHDGVLTIALSKVVDNAKLSALVVRKASPSSIVPIGGRLPADFYLSQNYPNPFNSTTVIEYGIPRTVRTRMIVIDIAGREVETIVDGDQQAGVYRVSLSARREMASGIYFLKLQAGEFQMMKKMILLK